MTNKSRKIKKPVRIGLIAGIVVILAIVLIIYRKNIVRTLGGWGIVPQWIVEDVSGVPVPKRPAYPRIDFPERTYRLFESECGFSFEIPAYSVAVPVDTTPCYYNVVIPEYKATIHLSYVPVHNNLSSLIRNEYEEYITPHLNSGFANSISSTEFLNEETKTYGLVYDLTGNTATSVTFYATDSLSFLRGALYFFTASNYDSLKPAIDFFREDVVHLIHTISWE